MSYVDAENAIRSLEEAARFDFEKQRLYVSLFKEFLRRSKAYGDRQGLPWSTPFIETVSGPRALPSELAERVAAVARSRKWQQVCTRACEEYLALLYNCSSAVEIDGSVYEPVFQLLLEGGSFYEHHGDICIGEAMIVLRR